LEEITSVEDEIILKGQSKFYIERLFDKLRLSYPVCAVLLSSIFPIIGLVVTAYTGEIKDLITTWWFYAGFISPILAILFMKYLRDKTIETILRIKPMIDPDKWKHKYLDRYFRLAFSSKYQLVPILAGPIIISINHYYNYYMGVLRHSFLWELTGFIGGLYVWSLIALIAFFCIGVAAILFNVGRHIHLKEEYTLSHDRMANLKPLATLGLINALAWVLPISVYFPALLESETVITPLFLTGMIGFAVSAFIVFVFPVYNLHRGMVHIKNRRLNQINRKIIELREMALKGNEPIEKLQFQLDIEKLIFDEIRAMKVWPIDFSTVLKLLGTLVVPLLGILIKFLIPTMQFLPS